MYEIHDTELNKSQNLPLKNKSNNPTYIWHLRLGHIHLKRIDRLVKEGPLSFLTIQPLLAYKLYFKEKMTKRPFLAKDNISKDVLELIHTDVCGLLNIRVRGDIEYFITFINDYSRYVYVFHAPQHTLCVSWARDGQWLAHQGLRIIILCILI